MSRARRTKLRIFRIVVFIVMGAFFLVPIAAMFEFSTRGPTDASPRTLSAWLSIAQTPELSSAIIASLELALLTSIGMLVLLVPTMIWVRLRVPAVSRTVEFLCLLPLKSPPTVRAADNTPTTRPTSQPATAPPATNTDPDFEQGRALVGWDKRHS